MNKLLIFTAMKQEAAAITKALAGGGYEFDLEVIGIRACRLPKDLSHRGASCIIMAGLAGGLDPTLTVGDIVVDEPASPTSQSSVLSPQSCPIHTSDRLITTAAEKAKLFRDTRCRAVDMENAIVRTAAQAEGIPFVGIRAISDTAGTAIDPGVLALVDEMGNMRPLAVAGLLLRRPGMVGTLRRLHGDSGKALEALGKAVRRRLNGPS